jgi:hypothetical protein
MDLDNLNTYLLTALTFVTIIAIPLISGFIQVWFLRKVKRGRFLSAWMIFVYCLVAYSSVVAQDVRGAMMLYKFSITSLIAWLTLIVPMWLLLKLIKRIMYELTL